ncbi:MAG: DnaJ domain-containing protein, partial [Myxococcales bacterium]|nr:DnaJ domain-containing protein [Myxococcales bacterium]
MARTEDILPGLGQKTLVPRLTKGLMPAGMVLSPTEGYVLSRVDGRTTLWEICLLVPLRRDETLRILRRLRAEGAIEIPGSLEPLPRPEEFAPPPAAAVPTSPADSTMAPPPARPATGTPRHPADAILALMLQEEQPPSQASPPQPPAATLELDPAPTSSHTPAGVQAATSPAPADEARPAGPEATAPSGHAPAPPSLTAPVLRSYVTQHAIFATQPASSTSSAPAGETAGAKPMGQHLSLESRAPVTRRTVSEQGGVDAPPPSGKATAEAGLSSRHSPLIDDTRSPRSSAVSRPPSARSVPTDRSQPSSASGRDRTQASTPSTGAAGPEECDLLPEQRQRIDQLFAQLSVADAFTLLGVTPADDKKAIQRAYFKLSKEFHPDRFFRKQLGPYRQRVAIVFQALTQARDILIDDERRRRYL